MITAMPRIAIAVHDFDAAVRAFRDVFGMPVVDFSPDTVPALGAHVGMCVPAGGSNIELMAASDMARPLSQALHKTLARRGEGLYALMLEAPDPDAEAVELAARGLDVLGLMAGAGGRDVHPRSTHGVLVRVYPNDSAATGGGHVSTAPHLTGIRRVIVATADASLAATAWGHGFGLPTAAAFVDDARGVLCVHCTPPKGGVIELVSVTDADRPFAREVAGCLKERNGGMYALVLGAPDPHAAAAHLSDHGVAVRDAPTGPEATAFGTRFLLEAAR